MCPSSFRGGTQYFQYEKEIKRYGDRSGNLLKRYLSEKFSCSKWLYSKNLVGHTGCVNALAFSKNGGEFLVSGMKINPPKIGKPCWSWYMHIKNAQVVKNLQTDYKKTVYRLLSTSCFSYVDETYKLSKTCNKLEGIKISTRCANKTDTVMIYHKSPNSSPGLI